MNITDKKNKDALKLISELEKEKELFSSILWINNHSSPKLIFGKDNLTNNITKKFTDDVKKIIDENSLDLDPENEINIVSSNDGLLQKINTMVFTSKTGINNITFSGNVVNGELLPDCLIYR